MRPVYATDATCLEVSRCEPPQPWEDATVEIAHTLRDDSGTVTTYYVPLTTEDALRLAKHLRKAATGPKTNETREA